MVKLKGLLSRNNLFTLLTLFMSGVIAYIIATRFTDFLFAPRNEKLVIILGCLVLAAITAFLLCSVILRSILISASIKTIIQILLLSLLITSAFFLFWYRLPPFPEDHTLVIKALGQGSQDSIGTKVHILSARIINYPSMQTIRIPKSDFSYNGVWRGVTGSEFELYVEDGVTAGISLNRFMQAGIELHLLTGPDGGLAQIIWDGQAEILDLYQPQQDVIVHRLEPALDWRKADRTRQVLVGAVFFADLLCALSLVFTALLAISQVATKQVRLDIRRIRLFFMSLFVIAIGLLFVDWVNQPVAFENPTLEAGVRAALNRPQGNLYKRQLLALVELDLSGSDLSSLNGIEQLSNLVSLNLRNNRLIDISPLSALTRLEYLDLKANRISNISPLANLDRLEYLNLYGNTSITSIQPLSSLVNLQKLILAYVPVGGQTQLLGHLQNLQYLNLRSCGVVDINFLTSLPELEYLNLHSNPHITDIDTLLDLPDLENLILANIPIHEQAHLLSSLKNLIYLNLRNTNLRDISFVANLDQLVYLNLHSNPQILSIEPLSKLNKLEHLTLRDVPINDQVEYLESLVQLKSLNIRNTGISSLSFLSKLIAQGALQDNLKQGFLAELDIRDNPISVSETDGYAAVRSNWENITYRDPRLLPFYAALQPPVFSQPSGFYSDDLTIALSHNDPDATIYFTTDGSEPSAASQIYLAPISVNAKLLDGQSAVSVESIAANWETPKSDIQRAVVVRAKAISTDNSQASETVAQTYFIGQDEDKKYSLPVVSLVLEFEDFFDGQNGIYVLGDTYLSLVEDDLTEDQKQAYANFNQRGQEWEKPVHMEYFDTTGESLFSQNIGVRIHGGGSRRSPQKSLRLYADDAYDTIGLFNYPFFPQATTSVPGNEQPVYQTILLRNFGQDWLIGMLRDMLGQEVLQDTGLDLQAQQPVIVFLNGEYWGIYQLQERYDEYYLRNHYGIDFGQASILRQDGELFRGNAQDARDYADLLSFLQDHDLSQQENFDHVMSQVDIENFTDYLIANMYLANTDWPDNNIYIWRTSPERFNPIPGTKLDGRWRWMIFDLDFAFGLQGYGTGYQHNTLQHAQMEGWSGELFRSLLENETYQRFFIDRYLMHLNTTFSPDNLLGLIDRNQELMQPEMDEFFARWGSNTPGLMMNWIAEMDGMREFVRNRGQFFSGFMIDHFGLNGSSTLSVELNPAMGIVIINDSMTVETAHWEGEFFNDIPVHLLALPADGYRFSHWQGLDQDEPDISVVLTGNIEITPVFIPD